MNILVLAGGLSPERNVALSTGAMVTQALRSKGHNVALVDCFMGLQENVTFDEQCKKDIPESWFSVAKEAPKLKEIARSRGGDNSILGPGVLDLCKCADVVWLALHGGSGEDGRIPALLDLLGISYTGSDYLASGLAIRKDLAKTVVQTAGVRTPHWQFVTVDSQEAADKLLAEVKAPIVVKIPDGGSSVGVYVCKTQDELKAAVNENIGERLLIEEFIQGREIQMAFLRDKALPSIEIVANKEFYDYESKYQKGIATEITPADILPEQEEEMADMLLKVAKALNLYTYSRADFIIDGAGRIYFIEINSLPGMTATSLVPQEAAAAGISFPDLCEMIAEDGMKRRVGVAEYLDL